MSHDIKHTWTFRSRFRRRAFGWRSQPPIKRIKEAVLEIKKAARKDPVLGGEGAVLFLEKVSPAIENVDGSSGAIGAAVFKAIETLVPIIAEASVDDELRDRWMERLRQAVEEDNMTYIETLTGYWGELCATPKRASRWAARYLKKWFWWATHGRIKPLRDFAWLLRRHEDGILAYFDLRIDNGATEAMNNNAKQVSHRAHGFRTPTTFSINLYHCLGKLPLPQTVHKFL